MNRYYPHPIIAREGWPFILGGLALSLLMTLLCGWWSVPFWLFVLFCLQFFRDPVRDIPDAPDALLCPADGRIVVVEKAADPYRNTEALKISVFMNVFNVHSQRAPANGTVSRVEYSAGKFLNAALDKASSENERNAVLMTTAHGRDITFVQVAGLVARRILCYAKAGETLVRGERYGFIRFGSRVDVYLPVDAVANVAIGDKVRASETVLAYLPLEGAARPADTAAAPNDHGETPAQTPESSKALAESRLKADKAEAEKAARLAAEAAQAEAEEQARLEAEAQAQAEAEEQARLAAEAQAKAEAEEQARLAAEAQAQAEAEEQARLAAEAQAKAEAEEQARLEAEAQAQTEAEEQARLAAEAEEQARLAAEAQAQAEAEEQARLAAEAEQQQAAPVIDALPADEAQERARLAAENAFAAEAPSVRDDAQDSFRRSEEQALAEIAARAPIVRREVFASVPEPWQTIEPSEIIIKTEVKK